MKTLSATAVIISFLLMTFTPSYAAGSPYITASVSTPSQVALSNSFTVKITVANTGKTGAYCVSMNVTPPTGFSVDKTSIFVGDLSSGAKKTFTLQATAPAYTTKGSFGGMVMYSDNFNCKGTSLVSAISGSQVAAVKGFEITIVGVSTSGHLKFASVSIKDKTGKVVAFTAGASNCSTCEVRMKVNLLSGNYAVSGGGKAETAQGERNVFGTLKFSADRDKSITMNFKPLL